MKKHSFLYLSKILIVGLFFPTHAQEFNSVRIAYYCLNDNYINGIPVIKEDFLLRAKRNNYTHIMVEYFLPNGTSFNNNKNDWGNGIYNNGKFNSGGLYELIQRDIEQVLKAGLHYIPLICVGSPGYGGFQWLHAFGDDLSKAIDSMDVYSSNTGRNPLGIPCIAPDMQPSGFDRTFEHFVRVLEAACNTNHYNLSFICLNYSEAFLEPDTKNPDGQLIYGTSKATDTHGGTGRSIDQLWLNDSSQRKRDVVDLVIASLKKRISTMHQNVRGRVSKTKLLIYGDLYSDEFQDARGISLPTKNLPSRASSDLQLKDNLIFLPWWYDRIYWDGKTIYNNYKELSHFISSGFPIIYMRTICDGNSIIQIAGRERRLEQLLNSVTSANLIRTGVQGFCSAHWDGPDNGKNPGYDSDCCWNTMEYLAYANGVAKPDIAMKQIPPKQGTNIPASFWDATEVTQGCYLAITGKHPFMFFSDGDLKKPAENVTWFDAILYCNIRSKSEGFDTVYTYSTQINPPSLAFDTSGRCIYIANVKQQILKNGYRLPELVEWQYAYLAGADSAFYWAQGWREINKHAWNKENSKGTPRTVGLLSSNAWGLFDMAGNVEEWVWSDNPASAYTCGGSFDYPTDKEKSCDTFKYNAKHLCNKNIPPTDGIRVGFRTIRRP